MNTEHWTASAVLTNYSSVTSYQVKQTQHLAEMLTPELENALKKEEKMVKELEQVEQEGKAYMLQLEGMKERFGGRLGQISSFLGLNTKK